MASGQLPPSAVTKTEAAFRALRFAIEERHLAPGERLRVAGLVETLGMSPTPIREALRLLQAEGVVQHHPHRGMVVSEFSPDELTEIYRLRVVLEPLAAELAAARADDEQIAEARGLQDELRHAVDVGDYSRMADLNARWHDVIHTAAGSRYLAEFIGRLWNAIPVPALWLMRRASNSLEEHEVVVEALERRNPAAAATAMRRHIESGASSMTEHLRECAEKARR